MAILIVVYSVVVYGLYACKFIIRLIYVNMGMTIIVKYMTIRVTYGELFDIYIYMCGTYLGES